MEDLEISRMKLFSRMMGQICTKSQKEIARAGGWAQVVRTHNVVELLDRIVAIHGMSQSTDPGQQKLDVRK